jgi:hypothetical protein
MWSQSQEAEQAARRGIDQLQKGIEKAADSVLGSEAKSLRRAQSQLKDATTKLASEVQAATGEDAAEKSSDDAASDVSGDQYSKESDSEAASDNGEQSAKSNAPEKSRRPGQRGQQKSSSEEKSAAGGSKTGRQPGEEPGQPQEGDGQSAAPEDTAESQNAQPGESDSSDQKSGSSQRDGQKGQNGQKGRGDQKGSDQKGEGKSGGESASEGEQGSQGQQNQDSKSGGQAGQRQKGQQQQGQAQSGQRSQSSLLSGGREGNSGPGANNAPQRPLTGDDFGEWSDQLRDIEEMLDDPDLRNRVAQVRDRARAMRAEFKRHGEMPKWDLVKSQLLGEMLSLQQRINQEVAKLDSDHAMVPIDREPVPEQFDSLVQRYYELLGQKRNPNEPLSNQDTSPTKQ